MLFLLKRPAMKQHIPNLLTLLNVLCGSIAVVFAAINRLEYAALFVFAGIFFDYFDGMMARWLDVKSELGIQLDSLADMVTCGVVPGVVMFQLLSMSLTGGWNMSPGTAWMEQADTGLFHSWLPLMGFLIPMASAYRLARFNIDEDQQTSFIGLPTPANAILILSFPLILLYQGNDALNTVILNPWTLIVTTLLSSFLLNAPIRLFALKFGSWSFKDNALRYVFILVSLVLIATMKFMAIPIIIAFYILSSLITELGSRETQSSNS